jgi:hypothetical protein
VRVIQRRQHLRLALEARETVLIKREDVREDCERHVAIQLGSRVIHFAHTARAERGKDLG